MKSQPPTLTSPQFTGIVEQRIVATMRLILAASALLIILIDPSEPDRLIALTYTALGLYTAYSALIYISSAGAGRLQELIYRWAHWGDVGWYVLFIALSRGTSSIFFFFF